MYNTVHWSFLCARKCQNNKKQKKLPPFSPAVALDFVSIDIPGRLSQTKARNNYIFLVANRYPNLAGASPTAKVSDTRFASIFIEHCMANFKIKFTVSTNNGPRFTSYSLANLARHLASKQEKLQSTVRRSIDRSNVSMGPRYQD